ncbi:HpcH/HpaI aldolase/citrate lyase family protein [Streptomyces sp. NBC_00344]|uniref:HpcH/HpaI aldolase/citrate lyase family protein n=1 Tax=Streptomyces sp. NBC_00344 TaxID=2975720 RepID=UPI002E1D7E40
MNTVLTWLYVPGDRPEVVAKALHSGADVVLVDLEDAVAPDRKAYAREATAELLSDPVPGPSPVHVRINALDGPLAQDDVRALAALPGLAGLRLPKAGGAAEVRGVAGWAAAGGRADLPLFPILESALGVERAYEIATATPTVCGLALGEADLRADLGVLDEAGLAWPRSRAVIAARAAGLAPPAQSVFPDVRDLDGLAASCARGRALGFLGRAAIHPAQLPVIEQAYLPSREEVSAAEDIVLAAAGDAGALALADGRFVDAAVVAGARRTLELSRRGGR